MIPWSPSQSEPDRLRSCIEGLAHDELAHRVDVFSKYNPFRPNATDTDGIRTLGTQSSHYPKPT